MKFLRLELRRGFRADDKRSESAMEDRKKKAIFKNEQNYFNMDLPDLLPQEV